MIKNSFRCPLNTVVMTNHQVIDHGKSIMVVIHELDDGNWKFYSRDDKMNSDEKPVLVSLADILMIDPSVGEVAHMPAGSIATRNHVGEPWKIIDNRFNSRAAPPPRNQTKT